MKGYNVLIEHNDLIERMWRDSDRETDEIDEVGKVGGFWIASWPEHVISKRYNSDCDLVWVGDTIEDVIKNNPRLPFLSCLWRSIWKNCWRIK